MNKKDFTSDQEVRWCPGCGDYAILSAVQGFMPELGIEPHKTVFVSGIGCSGRFTYYMDTYGVHGIHGRAPATRDGHRDRQPRPVGLGRHRRRRRPLDRRQPPDPRPPPEREPEDPAVQQPDLRAHEGSVLAHQRRGQGHEVDAVRLGRPPVQPDRGGAGRRSDLRGAHDRQRPSAPHRGAAAGRGAPRDRVRRDLSELQRVQRRCVRPAAREVPGRAPPDPAGRRRADHLRRGQQVRDRRRQRTAAGPPHRRGRPRSHRGAPGGRTSVAAVRSRAPVAGSARGDVLRGVPQLRAAGLRRGDARAAAERRGAHGRRRPRRRSCTAATPGRCEDSVWPEPLRRGREAGTSRGLPCETCSTCCSSSTKPGRIVQERVDVLAGARRPEPDPERARVGQTEPFQHGRGVLGTAVAHRAGAQAQPAVVQRHHQRRGVEPIHAEAHEMRGAMRGVAVHVGAGHRWPRCARAGEP